MKTIIKNCHIISDGIALPEAVILIEDERIADIMEAGDAATACAADKTVDAAGMYAMPGFIDIHSHGAKGSHICDGTLEAVEIIAEQRMRQGVTTFCPGTVSMPPDVLRASMTAVAAYRQNERYAKVAGVHLEGPFLNSQKLGGQNPRFILPPNIDLVRELNAITPVSIVSMAPELDGSTEFIRQLTELGIVVSAAHTAADYDDIQNAKRNGLRHLTHFCNQMTALHHRDAGAVGAGLLDDDLRVEIIADKIHLCPEMIRLIFKCKRPDAVMLITDASYLSGLPDGKHELRGLKTEIRDGIIRLADSDTLCGSNLRYNVGFKNVFEITGLPLERLVRATSLNQAEALNLKNVGRLEPGYLADIAILNKDFEVMHTFINGIMKF